jgi:hypothetical protein
MCDPIWKGFRDREVAAEQVLLINLDDVEDGIKELERAARLGLAGAMITEYPLEHRRYDQPKYEPFWAAAEALDLPLSLHTATRRQGRIRGAGEKTLRDASSRATKAFYPALDGFIEVLVHAFDEKKMVLAFIDRAAIDDAWPDRRLSNSDRKLLVDRNLTVISELIAGKYERGEITTYQGTGGQVFPRIDIATVELAAVRNRLSDTMVLDVAAVSGFKGAF